MSENYRFHAVKMAELRPRRETRRPLHGQLVELLTYVEACEQRWDSCRGVERTLERSDEGR
jgi:hypothetical protein